MKNRIQNSLSNLSKIPPQAIDIEETVLGCIIEEPKESFFANLKKEYFYKEGNQLIFDAILSLRAKNHPVDILTVTHELKALGTLEAVGGGYYISILTGKIPGSAFANIDHHIHMLKQKFILRELISLGNDVMNKAFDEGDPFDILDLIEKRTKSLIPTQARKSQNILIESLNDIFLKAKGENNSYFRIGSKYWDDIIGFTNGFNIWAGGSKTGKTSFLIDRMSRLLRLHHEKISVMWIAIDHEDGAKVFRKFLGRQILLAEKELTSKKRKLEKEELDLVMAYKDEFSKYDIEFIEKTDEIEKLMAQFKAFCESRPGRFKMLVLDNLMSVKGYSDDNKESTRMGTIIANSYNELRDQNVQMIILHHLTKLTTNKENAKTGFRPTVNDVRGSGLLDAKADMTLLFNRPGKYPAILEKFPQEYIPSFFIVDVAHHTDDQQRLIYFWSNIVYSTFDEINELNDVL